MEQFLEFVLNVVLFFPIIAAIPLMTKIIPEVAAKYYVVLVSLIELILSLILWVNFEHSTAFQFVSQFNLFSGISYFIGIDGISLFLVILTTFITFISAIYLNGVEKIKNFFIALLFLESATIGVFVALDVILFYIFWEFSLVPMLYIIGAWGSQNRIYASVKFFLYTFAASVIMLFGIAFFAFVYFKTTGQWSFNLLDWYNLPLDFNLQILLFIAFFIGIAVKVPMFPLHTWLPYAHGQAPTVGSIVLAAVLLKMGTYAFVRYLLPLFPDASIYFVIPIAILCVIMVIYTAFIAFIQDDMKQVIAYSSISHMGIIVLGTFAMNVEGIGGSVFFMLSHGIISGALFMCVGILYDRTHTKLINHYGGVAHKMPLFTAFFGIILMGSIGLPLTMGFVGEFLSLFGFFKINFFIAILAGSGIILGAIYMLHLFRNVFLGEAKEQHLARLHKREIFALAPLVIIIIWLGIYPKPILDKIDLSAKNIVVFMSNKAMLESSREFLFNANNRRN